MNMHMYMDLLTVIARQLRNNATVEYPGYIAYGLWNFGVVNGVWGGDREDQGEIVESVESMIPESSTEVQTIVEWIRSVAG